MDNQFLEKIQHSFFEKIKHVVPKNISLTQFVAGILGISYDSASRRIRCEKPLTIGEIQLLGTYCKLSIDAILFDHSSETALFSNSTIQPTNTSFQEWMSRMAADLRLLARADDKRITYGAKDPPIWHHWNFSDIAAFKVFFWKRVLLSVPEFQNKVFGFDENTWQINELGEAILKASMRIPTIELWNEDTFNILLRQVEYCWVSGFFGCFQDVERLCDSLVLWVNHIRHQAELGYRYKYGDNADKPDNALYHLYNNDVVLNDNSIVTIINGNRISYITYNTFNLLTSSDDVITEQIHTYLELLRSKSTLISGSASKERARFFNTMTEKIEIMKNKLKHFKTQQ